MALEKTVPQWDAVGTEPPSSLKTSGFTAGYKPPAAYFNWFWHSVSECLSELQEVCGAASGIPVVSATTSDGVTYTGSADGIESLTVGLAVIFVPEMSTSSTTITFNLNGLGSKNVRQSISANNTTGVTPANAIWLYKNKPIMLIYNGTQWMTVGNRASASDLYGTLAISKGGTGATTASAALTNLGAAAKSHTQAASTITAGTFAGQVVANSSGQTPGTYLLRNQKMSSTEETPTVNGQICWQYE